MTWIDHASLHATGRALPPTPPLYRKFCRWCRLPFWTPAPNRRPCCDAPECRAREREWRAGR